MSADLIRSEAAQCLDTAALMLYRAAGKLERLNEKNQSAAVTETLNKVRRMRDGVLQQKGDVNTAPDQ